LPNNIQKDGVNKPIYIYDIFEGTPIYTNNKTYNDMYKEYYKPVKRNNDKDIDWITNTDKFPYYLPEEKYDYGYINKSTWNIYTGEKKRVGDKGPYIIPELSGNNLRFRSSFDTDNGGTPDNIKYIKNTNDTNDFTVNLFKKETDIISFNNIARGYEQKWNINKNPLIKDSFSSNILQSEGIFKLKNDYDNNQKVFIKRKDYVKSEAIYNSLDDFLTIKFVYDVTTNDGYNYIIPYNNIEDRVPGSPDSENKFVFYPIAEKNENTSQNVVYSKTYTLTITYENSHSEINTITIEIEYKIHGDSLTGSYPDKTWNDLKRIKINKVNNDDKDETVDFINLDNRDKPIYTDYEKKINHIYVDKDYLSKD